MSTPVAPAAFVEAMRAKWTEYGNVESPALHAVWAQIAATLNAQTLNPTNPRPVIPAELGAGKTTAAKLWCAMLPEGETHPGALVVVRTIDAAEEFAQNVNAWATTGAPALAYHSELKPRPTLERLAQAPVLVICHRGYELALEHLLVDERDRYDNLMAFRNGRRRIVIVDEAIDQVYVPHLAHAQFLNVQSLIDTRVGQHHPRVYAILNSVAHALRMTPPGNHVPSAEALLAQATCSVPDADAALVALWQDIRTFRGMSLDSRRQVKEALTALRRHLAAYRWIESMDAQRTLLGARLLLPPDAGQVVFDATGQLSSVYCMRPDAYALVTMPRVRDYRAVTLHVARTRGTGKYAMKKRGFTISQAALDAVRAHYGPRISDRRLLVVTNMDAERTVRDQWTKVGFSSCDVAHWNKIDGRNDWRDCDTLVILTLPWARRSTDLAAYVAICGAELTDASLDAPPEDVRAIRETRIAAELAQAIGRIRLRRMVHSDGTCEPSDVFIRVPHNFGVLLNTDRVIESLQQTLAGLTVADWTAASEVRSLYGRPPTERGSVQDALLAWAMALSPGERCVLTKGAAFSRMSWNRALADAQRGGHALHQALTKLEVRLEPGGYRAGVRGRAPAELVRQA